MGTFTIHTASLQNTLLTQLAIAVLACMYLCVITEFFEKLRRGELSIPGLHTVSFIHHKGHKILLVVRR